MKPITILIALLLSISAIAQVKLEYGELYKTNNYVNPENLIKINDDRFLLIRGGKSQSAFEKQEIDCFELYDGGLKRLRSADFPKKHGDKKASYQYSRYLEDHVWAFYTQNGEGKTTELWAWELDTETLKTKGDGVKLHQWDYRYADGLSSGIRPLRLTISSDGSKMLLIKYIESDCFATIFDSNLKIIKERPISWASNWPEIGAITLTSEGDVYIVEGESVKKGTQDEFSYWLDYMPYEATDMQRMPIAWKEAKYLRDIKVVFHPDKTTSIAGFYGSEKGSNYAIGVFKSDIKDGKLTEPVLSKIPLNMLALSRPDDRIQPKEGKSYQNKTFRNVQYVSHKNGEFLMICQNENSTTHVDGKLLTSDPKEMVLFNESLWFFYFNAEGKVVWNDWMKKSQISNYKTYMQGLGMFAIPKEENLHILFTECGSNYYKSLNDAVVTNDGKIDNRVVEEIEQKAFSWGNTQRHIFVGQGVLLNPKTLIAPYEEKREGGLVKIVLE